jgi:putative tryptophan/tyrosine transport system substrate-binding protein
MRRRKFIKLLGAAAAWPLRAVAQQSAMPTIGFIQLLPQPSYAAAFHSGLGDTGFVEGTNVAVEYRTAEGQNDRYPALVAEMVRLRVSVIAILGSTTGALAAKAATQTIPIVFLQGADPVRIGLVSSLNQPGGNITGISIFLADLAAKRFGLLLELVPSAGSIGYLCNPTNPVFAESERKELQSAADARRVRLVPVVASRQSEIEAAFERLANERVDALFVSSDGYLLLQSDEIVARAASRQLPAVYAYHEAAAVGGLVSYGTGLAKAYRQAGVYTGRILKGEKPSDLPVTQPTSIDLAINLKTAKALGLAVPLTLLARADEVIE